MAKVVRLEDYKTRKALKRAVVARYEITRYPCSSPTAWWLFCTSAAVWWLRWWK